MVLSHLEVVLFNFTPTFINVYGEGDVTDVVKLGVILDSSKSSSFYLPMNLIVPTDIWCNRSVEEVVRGSFIEISELVLEAVQWQWCRKKKTREKKIPGTESHRTKCPEAGSTEYIGGS